MSDQLKSMLNNLINDKSEEASLDFHSYITAKLKELTGQSSLSEAEVDEILESATEEELEEAVRAGFQSTRGEEREKDDPWNDPGQADDDKPTLVRPKNAQERQKLAQNIKAARRNARDPTNAPGRYPATAGKASAKGDATFSGKKFGAASSANPNWNKGEPGAKDGKQ
jgi:hypothetical protein